MDIILEISRYVLYFTIFAVAGYVIEALNSLYRDGKAENRGFLFGPYLPIYGFGAVLMVILTRFIPHNNILLLFLAAMATGVILEYITSFLLEKIFHLRWWDYSTTDKFHLNGRVCLRNALAFGFIGCLFMYFIVPLLNGLFIAVPGWLQITLAVIISVVYLIDFVASSYANFKIKNIEDVGKVIGDQTRVIKKNAKRIIKEKVKTKKRHSAKSK